MSSGRKFYPHSILPPSVCLPDHPLLCRRPPPPRNPGTIVIRTTVKNEGTASGTGTVEFLVDRIQLNSKSLTLQPGREKTLNAIWSAVEGNHTISVRVTLAGDSDPSNNEEEWVVRCLGCGSETQYSEEEDDHYCWEYGEYITEIDHEEEAIE